MLAGKSKDQQSLSWSTLLLSEVPCLPAVYSHYLLQLRCFSDYKARQLRSQLHLLPSKEKLFWLGWKVESSYFAIWMPEAAGRGGVAQGQVSLEDKSFTFLQAGFHCKPHPGGTAPQTAEPIWWLTASLPLSLLSSCLASPSLFASDCLFNALKLQETIFILPRFCCSSIWSILKCWRRQW